MTEHRVPIDPAATDEIPEADAMEQRTEVVDLTAATSEVDDRPDVEPAVDDERVVALDEDEYR